MNDLWRVVERMWHTGDWFGLGITALIVLLVLFLILAVVVWAVDWMTARTTRFTDVVKDRHYNSAKHSTGVGPTIGGNGGVAVTTSYAPEEYWLEFEDNGLLEVDRESFTRVSIGDRVVVGLRLGGFTGEVLAAWVEGEA